MAARIIDIARAAEVSPSAVSLALNNKAGVSGELRERILEIARNMGYRPAAPAPRGTEGKQAIRLLKIAKHGHIVNEWHNAFITEYLEGIGQALTRHDYKLEVSFFNRTPVEEIVEAELGAGKAGGLIVLGTELSAHELNFFTALTKPMVFIDTYFPLAVFDCVDMDNGDGVFRSVQYLYQMGHRNIGLVKSSYETRNFREREEGFREAMEYFSLPVREEGIVAVDPAYEQAAADMARFLAGSRLRAQGKASFPSAFFCMNDIIAYGCMKALREDGLAVPADVSVIGFDDLPSSAVTDPPLTSIRVSTRQIGERALERLSERIEGMAKGQPEKILVSGKLMIRGSVKKI